MMTSAALTLPVPDDGGEYEYGQVLAGVGLDGPAARLATLLDDEFLTEAGWDPQTRVLTLPAEHRLLGRKVCRVVGCPATAFGRLPEVCYSCFNRPGWG
jgi:hypothetical protein